MLTRVYLDTSVIGGYFDDEFSLWSRELFREFDEHKKIAVISDLTLEELEMAPPAVKALPHKIPEYARELVSFEDEAEALAKEYIRQRVVTTLHLADASHIAIATVERVNVLEVRSSREVLDEKEV